MAQITQLHTYTPKTPLGMIDAEIEQIIDAINTLDAAGYVVGPASATDGVPALYDGTTGKLLKSSTPTGTGNPVRDTSPTIVTPTIASFANAAHDHDDAAGGGQLNATNVFSAGTVPTARLGSGTANAFSYLRGDQTWSVIGLVLLDAVTTPVAINTTAAETTAYTFTIPGGTVGANDALTLLLDCEYLNNTGSNRGYRTRVKLGGTTVIDFDWGAVFGSSATRRLHMNALRFQALGATNSQVVTAEISYQPVSGTSGTVHTGVGAGGGAPVRSVLNSGTLSKDMTADQDLVITIQPSFSSANHEFRVYSGQLVLYTP